MMAPIRAACTLRPNWPNCQLPMAQLVTWQPQALPRACHGPSEGCKIVVSSETAGMGWLKQKVLSFLVTFDNPKGPLG